MIDRIYLRNYRVFEDELELLLPPGLVGIYGPNGAGKSTLLESILWALWGKARTMKEEVPSAGTHRECVAEVTFEHESHIYLVRRTITGPNATVRAQVHCDGLAMAEGVRDTGRYVHSVLGMDDQAFRASVFAEQKQLASFSSQSPGERRKLVLSLLGVTPLDAARDRLRADARQATDQHNRLREMLPDLEEAATSAADAEARAGAAEAAAAEEEMAAEAARQAAKKSREKFDKLDLVRQEHEMLVVEGRAVKTELGAANREAEKITTELADLAASEAQLGELEPQAARLGGLERQAQLLAGLLEAANELAGLKDAAAPPPPDEKGLSEAEKVTMAARSDLGSAQAMSKSAAAEVDRAKDALGKAAALSGAEDCPLCGQALGDAFARVQAHRQADLKAAEDRLAAAKRSLKEASAAAEAALAGLQRMAAEVSASRQALGAWEKARAARESGTKRMSTALAALVAADEALAAELGDAPSPRALTDMLDLTASDVSLCKRAGEAASRLRGRLERRPQAELALRHAEERLVTASSLLETLRVKVKALSFEAAALAEAQDACRQAETVATEAERSAAAARLAVARARAQAEAEAKRLADAQAQHARLSDLESASVHLGRTAELLNGFRNSVVASVGPRLAVQAADLFAELTDKEYDRLEVDPETYGLQICDGGVSYDLGRFSGSEVDLANLALRVAISEHVRFQFGGAVGLLVLDEVLGPSTKNERPGCCWPSNGFGDVFAKSSSSRTRWR